MHEVYLLTGSNSGNREKNLKQALDAIKEKIGKIISVSKIFVSEPWGFNAVTSFLNQAIKVNTSLKPNELLKVIQEIEQQMGRIRTGKGYTSRIIDVDIIFFNDYIIKSPELTIPHPLLQERKFALFTLCDLNPHFIHPVFQKTISELLMMCPDPSHVTEYLN